MKKPNKSKALDGLAAKLRTALERETTNIIEIGDILIESRKLLANEHGEWLPWLEQNFDLSERTAQRYMSAAEYAARQIRHGVSYLGNVAPTMLYDLAAGRYGAEQEAAILAATSEGRVDQTRAYDICDALEPKDFEDDEDLEEPKSFEEIIEAAEAKAAAATAAEDAETEAIFYGPSPLPPPEPSASPDVMVRTFDQAITALMQVMTKPTARFAGTVHTANDLQNVEDFIRTVADRVREARTAGPNGRTDLGRVENNIPAEIISPGRRG